MQEQHTDQLKKYQNQMLLIHQIEKYNLDEA